MISNHYSPNNMAYRVIAILLFIGLVLRSILTPVVQATAGMEIINSSMGRDITRASGVLPGLVSGIAEINNGDSTYKQVSSDLSPGVGSDWLVRVQEDIRQSEYHITWQEHTYLSDLQAAYQAPNREQNLRTYFTTQGIRLIPRRVDGDSVPWEMDLSLSGYRYGETVLPVTTESVQVQDERINYQRSHVTEWYLNNESGLQQGFSLQEPTPQALAMGEQVVLEMTLSGVLSPNLTTDGRMVELSTVDGNPVLRYGDLMAYDASGRSLPAQFESRLSAITIVIDANDAVYPINITTAITGLSLNYDWMVEGEQGGARLGWSVATAGDVNGDGYSDVIVGADYYDNNETDEGRAYVYHGSSNGLSTTPAWIDESNQGGARFGSSVTTAGDVNGDGYSDVIVGARYYDNDETDEGRAYVYYGSAGGLSSTPDWIEEGNQPDATFGYSVGTAGDVNGDGYSDVIIGASYYDVAANDGRAYVYYGGMGGLSHTPTWTTEGETKGARLGASVGTAGDVNGDGYSDVIIGAPRYNNGVEIVGCVYVYHGSVAGLGGTPAWVKEGDQALAWFGNSVSLAGDVNGDGYSDVVIGAYLYDNDQSDEGRAYVFHGNKNGLSTTPDWIMEGDQDIANYGNSVGAAGDVNGDGYADVIIGSPGYDNGETDEGRAYVYSGSADGLKLDPEWIAESDIALAEFGSSVGIAGDVNGDGYSDVIIGAPRCDNPMNSEGCAFAYYGDEDGLSASPQWTFESDQESANLGNSVGTAGDVNGDGYGDMIIAAPNYDNGQTDEGRVFVFHGSPGGLNATPDWTIEGEQDDAHLGYSAGTAGDVNGDGYSDVVIGAPGIDNDQGTVFVYHGSPTGIGSVPTWTINGDQDNAQFGYSVNSAGDVNGDGFSDVVIGSPGYENSQTNEGFACVYLGGEAGLRVTPNWTREGNHEDAQFGHSLGSAGDVNGDGFSDVIIGAPGYDYAKGTVLVFHGGPTGLSIDPTWTVNGDQDDAQLGYSVGTAGDANGDGYSDVIFSAPYYDDDQVDEGRVFVYRGSENGLSSSPQRTLGSGVLEAALGYSIGSAGDVNGDGYSDAIIGAPGYEIGGEILGRVYVYHGSITGIGSTPTWTVDGDQADALFGSSVSMAGDVNGDGFSDIAIGAPSFSNEELNEGSTYIYYGNNGGGLPPLPRQLLKDGSKPIAHLGLSDSATTFHVSLIGRMPLGRQKVKLQWQAVHVGLRFNDEAVIQGSSADWIDTGAGGVEITEIISGLAVDTAYHWRVRLLYYPGNALGLFASRWIHIPWAGWHESDLRTLFTLPPVSNAGADQTVSAGKIVTLDASASSDPEDNYPLTYLWQQVAGPEVVLSDPTSEKSTFSAPSSPAILTFSLTATDSLDLADPTPDKVVITVQGYCLYLPITNR